MKFYVRTCTSTTSRSLLDIKVIGQISRSHGFLVLFCPHDTRRQFLALSEGFTCLYFISSSFLFYLKIVAGVLVTRVAVIFVFVVVFVSEISLHAAAWAAVVVYQFLVAPLVSGRRRRRGRTSTDALQGTAAREPSAGHTPERRQMPGLPPLRVGIIGQIH